MRWLGACEGCNNPGVTHVFHTGASKPVTTAGPAAQATGLDGMPVSAEGKSLDPRWHRNGTGGDRPQLGCTVLRTERPGQGRDILGMLKGLLSHCHRIRPGTGMAVLALGCGNSPAPLSSPTIAPKVSPSAAGASSPCTQALTEQSKPHGNHPDEGHQTPLHLVGVDDGDAPGPRPLLSTQGPAQLQSCAPGPAPITDSMACKGYEETA